MYSTRILQPIETKIICGGGEELRTHTQPIVLLIFFYLLRILPHILPHKFCKKK